MPKNVKISTLDDRVLHPISYSLKFYIEIVSENEFWINFLPFDKKGVRFGYDDVVKWPLGWHVSTEADWIFHERV